MTDYYSTRFIRRAATVAVCTLGLLLVGLAPAGAHVEATAEGPQAGTGPVPASVLAEAESTTGIVGVKTQLPAGIDPDKVWLAPGPTDWALTATAERRRSGWCSEPWTPSWPADRITSVG